MNGLRHQRRTSAGAPAGLALLHLPWRPLRLLLALLVGLGAAGAQYTFRDIDLAGRTVQGVTLYGAEYVSATALSALFQASVSGGVAQVQGFGQLLLLPVDEDQRRAAGAFTTVQLGSVRLKAKTATWLDGKLMLPLETLARGVGAQYTPGSFTLPAPRLTRVSSLAGKRSDRLVLDLSRAPSVREELGGSELRLTLPGVLADTRNYTTRGAFVPRMQVTAGTSGALITLPLGPGWGYRYYSVPVRAAAGVSGWRLVVDLGPGIPRQLPALAQRLRRPLIVLDPQPLSARAGDPDLPLEVARSAAELLSKAGWQVRLTRGQLGQGGAASGVSAPTLGAREDLARRSDVFVSLDLGRFPGAARSGVTLYEFEGDPAAQIVSAYRQPPASALIRQAVGDTAESRTLSNLLRGELKSGGVTASQQPQPRLLLLGEAPHAALLLELGWPQNADDRGRLADAGRNQQLGAALARAVATFLTARANALAGAS